ncbi:hypothetical protein SAMN05518847_1271 [Paenibacillus sp. OV219]|nr:hypothetical protein SAMN05518847_1271 [Paenibacillus sp. OV219]
MYAKLDSKFVHTLTTTAAKFDDLFKTEVGKLVCIEFGSPSEMQNGIINFIDV